MSTGAVRPGFCLLGVQTVRAEVCTRVQTERAEVITVEVMTDVTNVQEVRKSTYASVASQASSGEVAEPAGVDVEMGGMGEAPFWAFSSLGW